MATASAVVDYHESVYTEMESETARRNKADRVLALEVIKLKQQVADINVALAKLTEMVVRAMNLARWHGDEVSQVEMVLAETASRVQVVEEVLTWDAHDAQTMYGDLPLAAATAA
jgi:hypothetical protein